MKLLHFHHHLYHHHHHPLPSFKLQHFFTSSTTQPLHPRPHSLLEKSIISIIKSSTSQTHLHQLHTFFITTSLITNPNIFLHFITRLSLPPFHNLPYSRKLLQLFPKPNLSIYNALIKAHTIKTHNASIGFALFVEMFRSGISPNSESASLGIKCCSKMGSLTSGIQVHGWILKHGHGLEVHLLTNLMQFYASVRMLDEATRVFDHMPKIDAYVYNVLIDCYISNGRRLDALTVFDFMGYSKGCEPTNVTCVLILKVCANLKELGFGERVHKYVKEHGFGDDLNVCNALITMYSSCGKIDKAKEVFKGVTRRDVVTWTSMISGLANGGCEMEAIKAFREMLKEGIVPGEQTFTAVLSACSRRGMVEEGRFFFYKMSKEFNIEPNVYHYGCLVDLMSRSGLIEEAYEIIMSMKVRPDAEIWRTLLGACNKRKNDVVGQRVVRHLTELKAQESGDFVLLLNMYLLAGDLEKAKEVKEMMEKQNEFPPACSTIEFEGKNHVFNADDTTHPQKDRTRSKLNEINKQLKIAGYVVEAMPEFQSKIERGEPLSLSNHSEKMAIAFGILSTTPGRKLKVAKDRRVCDDCHNFAKMVSTVYDREVIITDSEHCHRFREGSCSCNKR